MLIRHRDRISEVVDIVKGTFCFNPKDARAGPPAAAPWELLSHSGRPPKASHSRPRPPEHFQPHSQFAVTAAREPLRAGFPGALA